MSDRNETYFREPFRPNLAIAPEHRQMNALEYIAAQLGMIRAAMEAQAAKPDQK